jgi:hypothetical protein
VFYGSNHVEYPELQDPREIFDFRDSRYLNPLPEIRYHGSSPVSWDLGFYRSGTASCMILVRSGEETSTGYKHCYQGQRFFTVPNKTIHYSVHFL